MPSVPIKEAAAFLAPPPCKIQQEICSRESPHLTVLAPCSPAPGVQTWEPHTSVYKKPSNLRSLVTAARMDEEEIVRHQIATRARTASTLILDVPGSRTAKSKRLLFGVFFFLSF